MTIGALSVVIFFLIVVAFATYDWFWRSRSGQRMLPILKNELSLIRRPSSDRVVDYYTSYKSTHAGVGEAMSSSMIWEELRAFYLSEMQQSGWQPIKSGKVLDWKKDQGGRIERFRKGDYVVSIYYGGESNRQAWTYTVDVSTGLY